jgi:hypothetical protein
MGSPVASRGRWRVALGAVAALGLAFGAFNSITAPGSDYLQFWTIGRAMPLASYDALHRQPIPHARDADRAMARARDTGPDALYLTATPLYYAAFAWVSGASFSSSLRAFQLASFAIVLGGLLFQLRVWGYSAAGAWALIACVLWSAALYDDTSHGNVSRLYVGLTAIVLWAARWRYFVGRAVAAPALLALLVLFKPLLALAFPALLLLRIAAGRWVLAACEMSGFLGGALLGILLPSLLVGAPVALWADFLRIETHYVQGGDYQARSLGDASAVERLTTVLHLTPVQLGAIAALAYLAVVAIVPFLAAARSRARRDDAGAEAEDVDHAVLLGAAGVFVLSPLVWPHYYLLSMMFACFLLRPRARVLGRVRTVAIAGGLLLLAGHPFVLWEAFSPRAHLGVDPALNVVFVLGNVVLCGVGLLDYGRLLYRGWTCSR